MYLENNKNQNNKNDSCHQRTITVTAVRNKGLEHARMFWNILEQLGDSEGSFNTTQKKVRRL